ncbi:MAG TPA: hypothetical protein VLS89_04200 [Candidatus Nanopelagicales bacterium]|nr:hypothetical protein [Candidatus Nanopelagicales bacterium]
MVIQQIRPRVRARERGAAVFIVVLLIAMLTAIGLFAAHAASLSTTSSGHARQSTQTRYFTELALQAAASQLEDPTLGPTHVDKARKLAEYTCDPLGNPDRCCFGAVAGDRCFRFDRGLLESISGPLVTPAVPGSGSLGWSDLGYRVEIEMTDLNRRAMPPPPGMDLTTAGATKSQAIMVTLVATGVIYPAPTGGLNEQQVIMTAGTQEVLSAHVVVNNVPWP